MRPRGSPTSLPPVQAQDFDGPLDLLLDEVRRQNVEIENIAMAPIVSRFLEYMATAATRNVNLDMDWLHMAATLIHWKSRSLLPKEITGNPEPDRIRDSLVEQLVIHRRQAAEELGRRRLVTQGRFSRNRDSVVGEDSSEHQESVFLSVWDLVQQAREVAEWVEKRREERRMGQVLGVQRDDVTVGEMMEYLRAQLPAEKDESVDGLELLRIQPTPARRACLFLGMLELAKEQVLDLVQKEDCGPICLTKR